MARTKFLRTEGEHHFFHFVCEGCGATEELGILVAFDHHLHGCPEGCGAMYVLRSHLGIPMLVCVVCPIFEDQRNGR
jgi:hypothetical protein